MKAIENKERKKTLGINIYDIVNPMLYLYFMMR